MIWVRALDALAIPTSVLSEGTQQVSSELHFALRGVARHYAGVTIIHGMFDACSGFRGIFASAGEIFMSGMLGNGSMIL